MIETPAVNTRTAVELSDVEFNSSLEDEFFTQRRLERGAP